MGQSERTIGSLRNPTPEQLDEEAYLHLAVRIIGSKWRPIILKRLIGGELRFNQLRRQLPGITQRMLTLHLRKLEQDGLVDRLVYAEPKSNVAYRLNRLGATLIPLLQHLEDWGKSYCDIAQVPVELEG